MNAYAVDLSGVGCAKARNKAIEYALADISEQIEVRVESELYKHTMQADNRSAEYISHKIRTYSSLPIFGYTTSDSKDCVNVTLNGEKALPLYIKSARDLKERVDSFVTAKSSTDTLRLANLTKALDAYNEWSKLAVVATYLGGELPTPTVSVNDIEKEIMTMKAVSADIPQIAANILDNLSVNSLYINSVKLYGSEAATPFASLLIQQLRQIAKSSPERANAELNCVYSPEGDPFIISCEVAGRGLSKINKVILTSASQKVCQEVNCYTSPTTALLEKSFHSVGDAGVSGHFYSNWGTDGISLSEGDILNLFTRVNAPVELALINLSVGNKATVISLSDSIVKKVTASDLNRQLDLIKLKVAAPFGDEALI
ncbi:MAG: hypothetical protein LBV09_02720, partial [Deferribacteraceae bacterium]|nr:hypothetical protein [Deferribacteraceae bacterium]